jgi:hypothetical protein
MTSRFERSKQEEVRASRLAEKTEALKHWLEKNHPDIRFCTATLNAFKEDMGNAFFTMADATTSDEDFEFALHTMHTQLSRTRVPTPQETKSEVIEEILSLLSAHSRRDEFMLKSEETRLKHMSLDALQARLAELKYKIGAVSTPVSTLKAFVAETRADTRKYPGFPDLDLTVTAATIRNLSSAELRKLIRLHSVVQVNERLAGRS